MQSKKLQGDKIMVDLSVCIGSSCHVNGAGDVQMTFKCLIDDYDLANKINFSASFCMNNCGMKKVAVKLNGQKFLISKDEAKSFFMERVLPLVK